MTHADGPTTRSPSSSGAVTGPAAPPVEALAELLGTRWDHLRRGREQARTKRAELARALAGTLSTHDPPETSVVVFGSLARDELTPGSDIDWTLLVDGPADPAHLDVARAIGRHVREVEGKPPGREGVFGSLAFSHELIHLIGGEDDTNSNTTRRILLLLESRALSGDGSGGGDQDSAHRRVLTKILHRYLDEDRGLWYGAGSYKIPRFLLNDFVRYWRTMAVDFAYKQRSRAGEGWALRNLKLRMSRKLIFVAGLLTCFSPETELPTDTRDRIFGPDKPGLPILVDHFLDLVGSTPLDITARAILTRRALHDAGGELLDAYDEFLGLLADPNDRERLETLPLERLGDDPVFQRGIGIGHRFQQALDRIFLDPSSPFYRLTLKYGIF
jgi:predicted nucleotidyltransferase